MIFILLNVLEGIEQWQGQLGVSQFIDKDLPSSLFDQQEKLGALSLFKQSQWLAKSIDYYCQGLVQLQDIGGGEKIKQMVLDKYEKAIITLS